ncbi:hypothetical protein ABT023_19185 [Micromonospora sp. NPDC002296]|uniref:hypothetical protein n=1 Tax=Micromonospora sp. NPDC002296 TaxID=3154271 RepID=UPI0033197402
MSESIVATPFHDQNLILKAGVHLHWALPDALTRGEHTADGTAFPAVPTRWLVTRSRLAASGDSVVERRWVVESDYLHPAGEGALSGAIAFPVPAHLDDSEIHPFRFLGRSMPLAQWLDPGRDAGRVPEYLDELTAAGYGHPAFAAIYPNCRSVFGFHDPEPGPLGPDLQYDVIGWYRASGNDCMGRLVRQLSTELEPASPAVVAPGPLLQRLAEEYGWTPRVTVTKDQLRAISTDPDQLWRELLARDWLAPVDDRTALATITSWRAGRLLSTPFQGAAERVGQLLDDAAATALGNIPPERVACHARLRFAPTNTTEAPGLTLAVGNSGAEALAAYLADADATGPDQAAAVERQLAALLELTGAQQRVLDTNAKLAEAYHERTFRPVDGESRWTVSSQLATGTADATAEQDLADLPPDVSTALAELNHLQDAYDRTRQRIESTRRQIFSDWYKYLLCSYPPHDEVDDYPDADTVRVLIESDLATLDEQVVAAARLDQQRHQAAEQIRRSLAERATDTDRAGYTLRKVAGPRYYQPTEPVLLLAGDVVRPSTRYGQDHRLRPDDMLDTRLLPEVDFARPEALWQAVDAVWRELAGAVAAGRETVGFTLWRRQPWHPVLLDWEVEFFPRAEQANRDGAYDPDYINTNYHLDGNSVELALRDDRQHLAVGARFYSGSSILTSFAAEQMRTVIGRYLVDLVLHRDHEQFFAAVQIAEEDRTADFLLQDIDQVVTWYAQRYRPAGPDDPVANVVAAYRRLGPDFAALSQALSGFNEALLAHRQTMQLPVADPLAFADDADFTRRVRAAVQRGNHSAPMPMDDFNPIRAGALQIRRLRLVDSFGQVRDLSWDRLVRPEPLAEPDNTTWIGLPPRLVQPARLNLRWLAADADHVEAGAHAVSTPICGWILPNHLDDSLMFYDRSGVALGQVDQSASWEPAPGATAPVSPAQVHDPAFAGMNPHLRRVAAQLTRKPGAPDTGQAAFMAKFLDVIESALDTVAPENAAQQQGLGLLFGRPVAVVRARVNLELCGLPAVSQSWPSFDQDLRRGTRDSQGFTRVRFPVRIGARDQFDDGLLGFWKETGGGYADNTFYAALDEPSDHARIVSYDSPAALVGQAVDDPPEELTLLVDPRGKVHASSGVLPTKVIDIPPDQFTAALAAIEVTFLTAPLLTPRDQVRISLGEEPGYRWSWLATEPAPNGPVWVETEADATITRTAFLAHFPTAAAVWTELLDPRTRWLVPADAGGATVLAPAQRRSATLPGDLAGLEQWADAVLGIDPATGAAPAAPVTPARLGAALPAAADVWAHLVRPETGWLTPLDGEPIRARIVPADQRPGAVVDAPAENRAAPPELDGPFAGLAARIGLIFDLYQSGIAAMRADALFTGPQEIREGWLTLRPARAGSDDARTR